MNQAEKAALERLIEDVAKVVAEDKQVAILREQMECTTKQLLRVFIEGCDRDLLEQPKAFAISFYAWVDLSASGGRWISGESDIHEC